MKQGNAEKIQQEERFFAASKRLQDKVIDLENALERMGTTNADLLQKIEVLETNDANATVDEKAIDSLLQNKLKEDIDKMINEKVNKLLDPQLNSLRNDIAYIKDETNKAVKETRGTRSHLDKSLNKKATKIELEKIT